MTDLEEIFRSADPEPGEVYEELKNTVGKGLVREIREAMLDDFEEQSQFAKKRLDRFLENLSESPGARKVVEEYYEREFNEKIDASDPEVLKQKIDSVDSILFGDALPAVSKDQLRHEFGVEGSWGEEDEITGNEISYLAPEWVKEHEEEPYEVVTTSGTTGRPWKRAMTRNDWAYELVLGITMYDEIMEDHGIDSEEAHVAMVMPPGHVATEIFSEALEDLGADVYRPDFSALETGGKEAKQEAEKIIGHINGGEYGMMVSAMANTLDSGLGDAIKAGQVDSDLYLNVGHPFYDEHIELLENTGAKTGDIFGETEYPQGGGQWTQRGGEKGFSLPLDAQINLIVNEETGEVSRDGEGLFSYFPFALEGQVIPGIYVGGVNASLASVEQGETCQLLSDVERVKDPARSRSYFT